MISFTRDGKNVRIAVEYKGGVIDTKLFAYWEAGGEVTAQALSTQLQDLYEKSVEHEIQTAYEAGYKAGRQKKPKRTWFHSFITHINESMPDWKAN